MTTHAPSPSARQHQSTPRRRGVVRLAAGLVLAGLGLWLVFGGFVGLGMQTSRDADGFYMTGERPFGADGHAVVSAAEMSGTGPDIFYARAMVGPVKIIGQAADPDRELFLGLGPADEVARYLDGVEHSELVDVNVWPFLVDYDVQPGDTTPAAPDSQDFWVASVSGRGTLTLQAEMPAEDWRAVVMNADGSPQVAADLAVGATLPVVGWSMLVCFGFGGLLLVAGALVGVSGARAYRRTAR